VSRTQLFTAICVGTVLTIRLPLQFIDIDWRVAVRVAAK